MVELHGAVVQEVPFGLPQSSYYGPAFNTYNKAAAHYGTPLLQSALFLCFEKLLSRKWTIASHTWRCCHACCLLLQAIGTGIEARPHQHSHAGTNIIVSCVVFIAVS
jgi:hypothetical protein